MTCQVGAAAKPISWKANLGVLDRGPPTSDMLVAIPLIKQETCMVSLIASTNKPSLIGLRPREARDGRERGSTRCSMQKLSSVGKFHEAPR